MFFVFYFQNKPPCFIKVGATLIVHYVFINVTDSPVLFNPVIAQLVERRTVVANIV